MPGLSRPLTTPAGRGALLRSLCGAALLTLLGGCPPEPKMMCLEFLDPGCPQAARGQAFFDFPWPNDLRRTKTLFGAYDPNGTISLFNFPGGTRSNDLFRNVLLQAVLDRGAAATRGFGMNSAVFFTFTAPIEPTSLPSASASNDPAVRKPSVVLVNLRTGQRAPFKANFKADAGLMRPANLLSILPYPGFPLAEGDRYAAILFNGIRSAATPTAPSAPLAPASMLAKLRDAQNPVLDTGTGIINELKGQLAAVDAFVNASRNSGKLEWQTSDVIGFTVFTTQRPSDVSTAMRRTLDELDPAFAGEHFDYTVSSTGGESCGSRAVIHGRLKLPRFQQPSPFPNDPAFLLGGGDILTQRSFIDGLLRAPITDWDDASFTLITPCGDAPDAGWPTVVDIGPASSNYLHALQFASDFYGGNPPFAVLSIDPYFAGDRLTEAGIVEPEGLKGFTFFNFINPVAGRNNQRQQGAELAYLARFVELLRIVTSGTGPGRYNTFEDFKADPNKLAFYGHSQGAVPTPIGLAMTNRYRGAFLNAPGGGLYHALVYRADVREKFDSADAFDLPISEIDQFHPAIHAMQTLAEDGDAANYADDMLLERRPDIVMTAGVNDGCSELEGVAHITAAAGIQLASFSGTGAVAPINFFAIDTLSRELPAARRAPVPLLTFDNLPTGVTPATAQNLDPNKRTGVLVQLPGQHSVTLVGNNRTLVSTFFNSLFGYTVGILPNIEPSANTETVCKRAYGLPLSSLISNPDAP